MSWRRGKVAVLIGGVGDLVASVVGPGVAGIGRLDLGDAQGGDRARPVGDGVQARIVEGHDHAVTGDVRVGLEVAIPERDGRAERRERVSGATSAPPRCAMAIGAGWSR
jgi:hypothetical protein